MRFEIIERHIIDVPDSELTDGGRPLGKMTLAEVLDVIADLAESGMTMMIITHEMFFAREVSNRVVFMADGGIVEQGKPADVLMRPQMARTQLFLQRILAHFGENLTHAPAGEATQHGA